MSEYCTGYAAISYDTSVIPTIYIDGACENNGTDFAKAGMGVYWGPNDDRNLSEPLRGRQTNNRAEIGAAILALNQAYEYDYTRVRIVTDSRFLIDSVTKWMPNWKRNGWRTSDGDRVANRDDFMELDSAMKRLINVNWQHVQAHSGNPGNEAADKLARAAIKKH